MSGYTHYNVSYQNSGGKTRINNDKIRKIEKVKPSTIVSANFDQEN
jgi:hypothetical protein